MKDTLAFLLQGEPLRAIGYGAVVLVYIATRVAPLLGFDVRQDSLDAITLSVGSVLTLVVELARKYVFSPNTVEAVVEAYKDGTL